jgi:hypothetical protein
MILIGVPYKQATCYGHFDKDASLSRSSGAGLAGVGTVPVQDATANRGAGQNIDLQSRAATEFPATGTHSTDI